MFKAFRPGAMAFAALTPAFLMGCSAQTPNKGVPSIGAAAVPGPNFSLDTPVETIAANQRGKAILERDMPGLMSSGSYLLFEDMSLSQIATMSGGRLTETKLNLVQTDLAQLNTPDQ